jgi:hypothetical protein
MIFIINFTSCYDFLVNGNSGGLIKGKTAETHADSMVRVFQRIGSPRYLDPKYLQQ